MKKHIAPPATIEQMRRTLGITQEDIEVVQRVMRQLEAEDEELFSSSDVNPEPGISRYDFPKKNNE
jgi:NACalpha-BTF3-like transcription factor